MKTISRYGMAALFALEACCRTAGAEGVGLDRDFPGGNIGLQKIEGNEVYLHQELRDTKGDWFYWYFAVRGAAGRELTFHFTQSRAIGLLGPGVSRDDGKTGEWLGTKQSANEFKYKSPTPRWATCR